MTSPSAALASGEDYLRRTARTAVRYGGPVGELVEDARRVVTALLEALREREENDPPYLAIAKALAGLSDDALARIACWGASQPCGHHRTEHEVAVQGLLEAGYSCEVNRQKGQPQVVLLPGDGVRLRNQIYAAEGDGVRFRDQAYDDNDPAEIAAELDEARAEVRDTTHPPAARPEDVKP